MRKILPIVGVLALVVIVSGCVQPIDFRNCGSNEECFEDALSKCEATEARIREADDLYLHLKVWPAGDDCNFYYKVDEAPPSDMEMEGLDMTCVYPKGSESPKWWTIDEVERYCTGPFAEFMRLGY
jgi:hypothetical protein